MSLIDGPPDRHVQLVSGAGSRFVVVPIYSSDDGLFSVNVKRYEQVTLHLRDWPIDEVMHIISGQVEITDTGGESRTYKPGDTFVLPRRFSGQWRQIGTVEMSTIEYGSWR